MNTARGPVRIDYLTLRYTYHLSPPDLRTFNLATGAFDLTDGELRHFLQPVGQLRKAHGGIHLVLPGDYWTPRVPKATALLPDRWQRHTYNEAVAFCTTLDRAITSSYPTATTSVARVDWCCIVPTTPQHAISDLNYHADRIFDAAELIVPHRHGYTRAHHHNESGETVEILQRGKDVSRARERAYYWRLYHRPGEWGSNIRIELERKQLDGDTTSQQLHQSLAIYENWLTIAGLPPPAAQPQLPSLPERPTSAPTGAHDAWLRGAGHILAWALRAGYDLEPFERPLLETAHNLRVSLQVAQAHIKKYLDRQQTRLEAGQTVTVTEPTTGGGHET